MTWRPVLVLLVVAPFLGEVLSTATSPLELLSSPWRLGLLAALYGGGALLCRETAVRFRLGLPGLALLGAAYGVYEEALVDRFWFDRAYAERSGVGGYADVWHTNLLLAVHLTTFHTAVSICSSILLVTWLFPRQHDRPWLGPPGLIVTAAALLSVPFLTYESYARPLPAQSAAAIGVLLLLVAAAFVAPRTGPGPPATRRPRPRLLTATALGCTAAQFVLTYALPATGIPWPLGLAAAVTPVVAGVLLVRRLHTTAPLARDGLAVVTGILGFFIALDITVGLAARPDLTVAAILLAATLTYLHRRLRLTHPPGPAPACPAAPPPTR